MRGVGRRETAQSRSSGSAVGRLPWDARERNGLVAARRMRPRRDRGRGGAAVRGWGQRPVWRGLERSKPAVGQLHAV